MRFLTGPTPHQTDLGQSSLKHNAPSDMTLGASEARTRKIALLKLFIANGNLNLNVYFVARNTNLCAPENKETIAKMCHQVCLL